MVNIFDKRSKIIIIIVIVRFSTYALLITCKSDWSMIGK